jgi:hypothetical protein
MSDLKLNSSSKMLYAVAITGLFLHPSWGEAQTKGGGQKSTSGSTHSHSAKSNGQNSQTNGDQSNTGSGGATNSTAGSQINGGGKKNEIATLRKAKKFLEEANHDYRGHRARAMHAIHEAIRELEGQKQHAQNGHAGSATSGSSAVGHSSALVHGTIAGAHTGTANHNSGTQQGHANSNNQSSGTQMTQADSDSRLRSAQQLLMQAQSQIGGKHAGASTHIQVALSEVQQALQVKQGTGQE